MNKLTFDICQNVFLLIKTGKSFDKSLHIVNQLQYQINQLGLTFDIVFYDIENKLYKSYKFTDLIYSEESNWVTNVEDLTYIKNAMGLYFDKLRIEKMSDEFVTLSKKFLKTTEMLDKPITGGKNLVYFSIGYDLKYVNLCKIAIQSILQNTTSKNFDILILHSDSLDVKSQFDEFHEYNLRFFPMSGFENGVKSSMKKLEIFKYPDILTYDNILFLDADIVVNMDISKLLNHSLCDGVLYSTIHDSTDNNLHQTKFHTIRKYNSVEMKNFEDKNIRVFNAGQFLFKSSRKMMTHFDNILEFICGWKKSYFYEQSFMNYYFNYHEKSDTKLLSEYVSIVYIDKCPNFNLQKMKPIIHYAGEACNGDFKLKFVEKHFPEYL